jgi:Flp pilus assembly protein TadG
MKRHRRLNQDRRGAATVEFALCASILFMVFFAIIEFSRAWQLQQAVRQAAFEGARAGLTLDAATADVTTAATTIMTAAGVSNATITISPSPLVYTSPTVSVTVSANPVSNGWFSRFFVTSNNISATVSLNREVQAVSVP